MRKQIAQLNIFLREPHCYKDVTASFFATAKPRNSHLHEDCRSDAYENASNLHFLAEFGFLRPAAKKEDVDKGDPCSSKGQRGAGSGQPARDDATPPAGSPSMSNSLTGRQERG